MLVLGDLIAQEDLGLVLVSGGAEAPGRPIAGAHSIEVEAPARFLERGWVMLTAGLRLRGSTGAQRELVRELDEAGIAALGIGLDLVFKRVPPALLAEARERAFPVFGVPLDTAFRDIIGFINRSLLSSDLHTYQRLTSMQRHLIDALREEEPQQAVVERLARMLDAGVVLLDAEGRPAVTSGIVPDAGRLWQRIGEREDEILHEIEEDGWHLVAAPITPAAAGAPAWLVIACRRRAVASRLAKPAAQATVPLLAATTRLGELARDQERAVRSALLDEALELSAPRRPRPRPEVRGLAARAASFGIDFSEPARVVVLTAERAGALERAAAEARVPHLVTTRGERTIALLQCERGPARTVLAHLAGDVLVGVGRPVAEIADVPLSHRDAELAVERIGYERERWLLDYEDFDLCTLLVSEVPPAHIRHKVEEFVAPLRENPPLYEALVEYFARDMDVAATAEALHVHPNTLRYRLGRVEQLLGRSLRTPTTIADLCVALMATPRGE